jgi:hypothetical protein
MTPCYCPAATALLLQPLRRSAGPNVARHRTSNTWSTSPVGGDVLRFAELVNTFAGAFSTKT